MNILHLTNRDEYGAGTAAYRLHINLLNHGFNSKILVINRNRKDENIIGMLPLRFVDKLINKIKVLIQSYLFNPQILNKNFYFQDQRFSSFQYQKIKNKIPFNPDIIIVHWISMFLNFKQLYLLQKNTNALIIFHLLDMGLITGGCHYSWDCRNYNNTCGNCPALYSKNSKDLSNKVWEFKHKYINKLDCVVIAPTQLLYNQTLNSSLFRNKKTTKILLGINENIFSPVLKNISRQKFKIPNNHKSILIGTISFKEERKGAKYLIDAFEILINYYSVEPKKISLIIAGESFPIELEILKKYNIIRTGYVKDEQQLSDIYRAADFFVSASIEDSGPMMINESIISGTPVVSFEMGVAMDLVINGKTGYIAKNKNAGDLAYGINKMLKLSQEQYAKYSDNCRKIGMELFSFNKQGIDFRKLFEEKKQFMNESEY